MKEKFCSKCKQIKSLSEFSKNKLAKDGLCIWCKKCVSDYKKQYRIDHKEEIKRKKSEYYNINKKLINQQTKNRQMMFPWKETLSSIKQRCENKNNHKYIDYGGRGIKCVITAEELKILWFRDRAYEMEIPSIDRINNDGDYTFDNCQYLEHRENSGKNKRKPILQYSLNNILIKEWNSNISASKELNISAGHISQVCSGKRHTAGGYIWRYK